MTDIRELPQHEQYPFAIFEVGDGATVHYPNEAKAGTVVKVSKDGKRAWIQRDDVTRDESVDLRFVSGGFGAHCVNQEEQRWICEPNPENPIFEVSLRLWRGRHVWTQKGARPDGRQAASKGRREFYNYNL